MKKIPKVLSDEMRRMQELSVKSRLRNLLKKKNGEKVEVNKKP